MPAAAPQPTDAPKPAAPTPTTAPAPNAQPTIAIQAAPTTPPASTAGWQAEWDKALAAAKQEGKVTVIGGPGDTYREALVAAFEKSYPAIKVEYTGASPRDFAAKLTAERQASKYLVDVVLGGTNTGNSLKNQGTFDPLRSAPISPDVMDDKNWLGGFAQGFQDKEGQFTYSFEGIGRATIDVNREFLKASEPKGVEELSDPKWKGKIAINDPRTPGPGSSTGGFLLLTFGEEWYAQFLANSVPTRDSRQLAEWLVRGVYALSCGTDPAVVEKFAKEGLGQQIEALGPKLKGGTRVEYGAGSTYLVNKAPHPNAARLYLNWLLSKDGQMAWVANTQRNSRRLDVPGPPETALDPKVEYVNINHENAQPTLDKGQEIANRIIK
jgi:iron(III) transport system substrate-binding protein